MGAVPVHRCDSPGTERVEVPDAELVAALAQGDVAALRALLPAHVGGCSSALTARTACESAHAPIADVGGQG
jgi:hypothetical protein